MSRTTTFIAVLQTTLVVMGFLILPGIFKLWGYPVEPQFFGYRWNPLSLWLRQYGPWLLVLPAFWVAFVSVAQRRIVASLVSVWPSSSESVSLP